MVDDTVEEYQHGFRACRSTTDAIFFHRRLCEKYRQRQDGALHSCFVDLTAAFDTVSWDLLWHALRLRGTPEKLIQVLRQLLSQTRTRSVLAPSSQQQGSVKDASSLQKRSHSKKTR